MQKVDAKPVQPTVPHGGTGTMERFTIVDQFRELPCSIANGRDGWHATRYRGNEWSHPNQPTAWFVT